MWNLFKGNNNTTVLMTSFYGLCSWLWTYLTHCSAVSIADLEQANTGWLAPCESLRASVKMTMLVFKWTLDLNWRMKVDHMTFVLHRSLALSRLSCNFTKSSTPPWVFSTLFKLYKWYQIVRSITYVQFRSCTH